MPKKDVPVNSNQDTSLPTGYIVVGYDHAKNKQVIGPKWLFQNWTISWPPESDQSNSVNKAPEDGEK